jgi:hypothetical protein
MNFRPLLSLVGSGVASAMLPSGDIYGLDTERFAQGRFLSERLRFSSFSPLCLWAECLCPVRCQRRPKGLVLAGLVPTRLALAQ